MCWAHNPEVGGSKPPSATYRLFFPKGVEEEKQTHGPDWVRVYWLKRFPSLHTSISAALQDCVSSGMVPEWMIKGRTVFIQKDPAKGTVASNYRPIACLPLMWKLLPGTSADKIYDHLLENNLLPDEQKGCRKKSRGTKINC